MWPWSLVVFGLTFALVTLLDQHSTYLAHSLNPNAYETSLLPRWILATFGGPGLLGWGLAKIAVYAVVYGGLATWAARLGLPGTGRLGLVLVTYAYLAVATAVVLGNYRLAFA